MITKKKKKEKKAQVIVTTVCVERSFDKSFSLQYFFFLSQPINVQPDKLFLFFCKGTSVCMCAYIYMCFTSESLSHLPVIRVKLIKQFKFR